MTVDNNYLVVSNRVAVVDKGRDAVVLREGRGGVFVGLVALVQNDLNLYPTTMCLRQCLSNRRGREGVGLNENRRSGLGQCINACFRAAASRREVNLDAGWRGTNCSEANVSKAKRDNQ